MTGQTYTSAEMLEKLISFDTTSHKSNMELIDFVQDYLKGWGVDSMLIRDDIENKANLYATIGDPDVPGIILSGHTDVVPVEGQDWDTDPFELVEKNGTYYGRGTCDMKGFIAIALAKVPEMVKDEIKTPIHFAFSYDEEIGCVGVLSMAEHIKNLDIKPKLCIVGEPTMMKLITGQKGICGTKCHVTGVECHSSMAPSAVNAIEYAAELVAYSKKMARRMAQEGPFNQNFDPPHTTLLAGVIHGGTARNIVPNHCDVEFQVRCIPEQSTDEVMDELKEYAFKHLEPEMKEIEPKTGFEFKQVSQTPAFDTDDESEVVEFVKGLCGSNHTEKVSFGTEAGVFQNAGVPAIVCGPGSIEQAHKPNEFITAEQIAQCESFIDRLIAQVR